MRTAKRKFKLLPQGHPILILCVPHWVPRSFPIPVTPRSQAILRVMWRLGTHRQVPVLNQVTQASKTPQRSQRGHCFPCRALGCSWAHLLSLHGKVSSRASSPHQQAQKMHQFSFTFRYRGWVPGGGGEASTWGGSASPGAHKGIPGTTTTQPSTAKRCSVPPQQHHLELCPCQEVQFEFQNGPAAFSAELQQVGVSSRAGCHRDMPWECFQRAGAAHSASSWGICAT